MDTALFWPAAIVAAVLVGMGKGGIPVVGMLGVPILAQTVSPVMAAGLLLPVYVVSDMFGLYAYWRDFDRRVLAILIPGMTVGVGIGWATASIVPEAWVTILVGLVGAVFAASILLRRKPDTTPRPAELGKGLFWGAVTGFTSFVSHSGAPPYQVYTLPLNMPKTVFAGTATIAFAFVNAIKLLPYYALGQLSVANLKVALVLMPAAALAVFAGVRLVRRLPEVLFFRLVTWALLLISLKLIWDGASAI